LVVFVLRVFGSFEFGSTKFDSIEFGTFILAKVSRKFPKIIAKLLFTKITETYEYTHYF